MIPRVVAAVLPPVEVTKLCLFMGVLKHINIKYAITVHCYMKVFVLTHPRSLSTVFERVLVEQINGHQNGNNVCNLIHEPFSSLYYFKDGLASPVAANLLSDNGFLTVEDIKSSILNSAHPYTVVKDMGYHVYPYIYNDDDFLKRDDLKFIILVRDPKKAIASHYEMNNGMSYDEIGYEKLGQMLYKLKKVRNDNILVINADDLEQNTELTVQTVCKYIGIPYSKASLKWKPKELPEWSLWKDWHADASNSSNIVKNCKEYHDFSSIKEEDRDRIDEYYRKSMPIYNAIILGASYGEQKSAKYRYN